MRGREREVFFSACPHPPPSHPPHTTPTHTPHTLPPTTHSHPPLSPGDAVAVILAGGASLDANPLARYTAPAALKLGELWEC